MSNNDAVIITPENIDASTEELYKKLSSATVPNDEKGDVVEFLRNKPGSEARMQLVEKRSKPTSDDQGAAVPAEQVPQEAIAAPTTEELAKMLRDAEEREKKHRNANSRLGSEIDREKKEKLRLAEEAATLREELEELKRTGKSENTQGSTPPKFPKRRDFEDEDSFDAAVEQFNFDNERLWSQEQRNLRETTESKLTDLQSRLSETETKLSEAYQYTSTQRQQEQEKNVESSFDAMWSEAENLQKISPDLKTLIPVKDINESALITANPRFYTQAQIDRAEGIIKKAVSCGDDVKFEKLTGILKESLYDLSTGVAIRKDHGFDDDLVYAQALRKAGLKMVVATPQTQTTQQPGLAADFEKKREELSRSVQALPASVTAMGAGDKHDGSEDSKRKRLMELLNMQQKNQREFAKNSELVREKDELVAELIPR